MSYTINNVCIERVERTLVNNFVQVCAVHAAKRRDAWIACMYLNVFSTMKE